MNNYRKIAVYITILLIGGVIFGVVKTYSLELYSVEAKGWGLISMVIAFPVPFIWLIYIMSSLLPQNKNLSMIRIVNIILPLLYLILLIILSNFKDASNQYLVGDTWFYLFGIMAILSMIIEITTFFIKKQN
jgi:hypothetical protein